MRDLALRALSDLSLVMLAPLLLAQGQRVRRATPRLPEADGPREGRSGEGASPIRLLVIGESTAAGVGVAEHSRGLAGHSARALAAATGRPTAWRVLARSGATAGTVRSALVEPAAGLHADLVLVALGVNDTLSLAPPKRWVAALEALVAAVRRASAATNAVPVVLAAVPPMQHFPALPTPLRHVLGLRARVLDRAAARWARRTPGVIHVPHPATMRAAEARDLFCADGFHPSAAGYERWGTALAAAAAPLVGDSGA